MADTIEVGRFGTLAEADRHALVLAAVGIGCRLVAEGGAVRSLVAGHEAAERARLELTSYERENAPRQLGPRCLPGRSPPASMRPSPTAPCSSSSSLPAAGTPSAWTGWRSVLPRPAASSRASGGAR